MDFLALFIDAVKTTPGLGIAACHMVAVVGKMFAGREVRRLAHDLIAFHHQLAAVGVKNDPFAAKERDGAVGLVPDGDKVDESVRFVRRQAGAAVMVDQFVELSG